ncbi:hypothetical protein E3P99_02548 [Wallemia hederae]|uniref:Sas10 C-terminal domain-containing protein n=1 Tax=Wallemia hederae TaxID=1540922 RepID=A0A4T0FJQ2_9BASI|nr:hypothetical protein E3P99_02548 [Wallemia hederae]
MSKEGSVSGSLATIKQSIESVKGVVDALNDLEIPSEGLPLLTTKCHTLTQYIHDLIHLSTLRLTKSSIQARGASEVQSGDVVDDLIKLRVIHEKTRNLQLKMRYRIDKLVKAGSGGGVDDAQDEDTIDPLAFKPNPSALLSKHKQNANREEEEDEEDTQDGVYRPPKLAAVPYTDPESVRKDKKKVIPQAILPELMGGMDVTQQSNTGLGTVPNKLSSRRARELQHMNDYEEDNFMRLVHNKKENNRRLRDEADVALGGGGVLKGRRVGGLDGEFDDVLRAVDSRPKKGGNRAPIYDELDKMAKKASVKDRASAKRAHGDQGNTIDSSSSKRGRFDRQVGDAARKQKKRRQ